MSSNSQSVILDGYRTGRNRDDRSRDNCNYDERNCKETENRSSKGQPYPRRASTFIQDDSPIGFQRNYRENKSSKGHIISPNGIFKSDPHPSHPRTVSTLKPTELGDEDEEEAERISRNHTIFLAKFDTYWEKYIENKATELEPLEALLLTSEEASGDISSPSMAALRDSGSDLSKHVDADGTTQQPWAAVEAFASQYPDAETYLDKRGEEGKTILHLIPTKGVAKKWHNRIELFKWLMEKYPDLYKVQNDSRATLLTAVLQRKRRPVLQFLVKEFPAQTAELIKSDKPLIHQLLQVIMDSGCSGPLLECLDQETLLHTDKELNTILHVAASYNMIPGTTDGPDAESRLPNDRSHEPETVDDQLNKKGLRLIENLVERCPEILLRRNKLHESAYQHRLRTFRDCQSVEANESRTERSFEIDQKGLQPLHGDVVARLLKDRIMHLDDRDETIRLLYGRVQEREIHFDLNELAALNLAVSEKDLKDLITSLNFESILKYVRVPRYKLSTHSNVPDSGANGRSGQELIKRGDCQMIFDLLWERGVRKIIKIVVDDDDENPHSDEIIEKLARFDIEVWDWRKYDLCSDVVYSAAKDAKKLFLYSSGNSAVLKSWSGIDGLGRLQKLTEIHICIRQRFETRARTQIYLNQFEKRMHQNCPKARVHPPRIIEDSGLANQSWTGTDKVDTNEWLGNMDMFTKMIKRIPKDVIPRRDVRVAIIDDGIDKLQGGFGDSIDDGVSFYTSPGTFDTRPYYFSSQGHGTLMAKLIRRVSPRAKLYIARLDQGPTTGQPTAESAIKAIHWAIIKKVDIISMSWTFTQLDDTDAQLMKEAIDEAHRSNILTFGSASDQGFNNTNRSYPGNIPGVFCIGAATTSGHVDDAAVNECHFVFPGGNAGTKSLRYSYSDSDSRPEKVFGSSFATAVASGLAALILYCVEICGLGPEYRNDLQQYEIMKAVFKQMASGSPRDTYIQVTAYFRPEFQDYDWDEGQEKLDGAIKRIIRPCMDKKEFKRAY